MIIIYNYSYYNNIFNIKYIINMINIMYIIKNTKIIYILNIINIFFIKAFMLSITMKLDTSARLTPQVTTITCHHMKKVLLEKRKKIQENKVD